MRKFQIAAIVAFGAVVFAGAQLARAQDTYTVQATVSFPFMVGGVLMPAGTYAVLPDQMDPGLLEIQSEGGRHSAFTTVLSDESTNRRGGCEFQFVNVRGTYYLTKIDDGTGTVTHLVLPDAVLHMLHTGRVPASQR